MTIEVLGMIGSRRASETILATGPVVDADYVRRFAQAHEQGGFDRILIGYFPNGADGLVLASFAAAATTKIGVLVAHRPGFVAPPVAARAFATLDQFTGGRAAINIITGGDDTEQQRDGDYLGHDDRYQRTDEYLDAVRRIWTADAPVDHDGRFYRFKGALPDVRTVQQPTIPIFFGGSSAAAVEVAGKHADVYMLWGEPVAEVRQHIARVRAAAARHNRTIRFSLSFRPILGATEAEAWERAREILETIRQVRGQAALGPANQSPQNVGSQRLLDFARRGEVLDKRLWTAVAAITGARGNTTALVGTAEQVADSLLDYYDLGIDTFLVRGFDPLEDAIVYGRDLVPALRDGAARRPRAATAAA